MIIEQGIKAFFGGNALVAVIVLAFITIFLFREGFGFFGQNLANLRLYRQAGLEYVDIIRGVSARHEALSRNLSEIRLREVRTMEKQSAPLEEINATLAPFDQFASAFSDTAENLHGLVSDLTDQASALKEQLFTRAELLAQHSQWERTGVHAAAEKIVVPEVDRTAALAALRQGSASFESVSAEMTRRGRAWRRRPAHPDARRRAPRLPARRRDSLPSACCPFPFGRSPAAYQCAQFITLRSDTCGKSHWFMREAEDGRVAQSWLRAGSGATYVPRP